MFVCHFILIDMYFYDKLFVRVLLHLHRHIYPLEGIWKYLVSQNGVLLDIPGFDVGPVWVVGLFVAANIGETLIDLAWSKIHYFVRTYVDKDIMLIYNRQSVHYCVCTYIDKHIMLISSRQSVHYFVPTYIDIMLISQI